MAEPPIRKWIINENQWLEAVDVRLDEVAAVREKLAGPMLSAGYSVFGSFRRTHNEFGSSG
jgi:hypothetical protein